MTKRKPRFKFSFEFMDTKPTKDGHVYDLAMLYRLCERFTLKPRIIIQQVYANERKVRKIPLELPWDKKVMADVVSGEVVGERLIIHAECRNNAEGRKLQGIIEDMGVETVNFYPIGYGTLGKDNVINPDYKLNYIAVEPK